MLKNLVLFLLFFFIFIFGYGQKESVFCNQVKALNKVIRMNHYQPKFVDDSLSSHVFDLFLNHLDDDKRLLTQSDIRSFETDRFLIDNYIENDSCAFIVKYATVLNERLERSKRIISKLESENFDYTGKDTLRFKPKSKFTYFKNEDNIIRYWSKRLRYNILYSLVENDSVLEHLQSNFKTLESDLKPKLIQKELCILQELQNRLGSVENFVKEAFLNAYLHYHDPNSSFLMLRKRNCLKTRYQMINCPSG